MGNHQQQEVFRQKQSESMNCTSFCNSEIPHKWRRRYLISNSNIYGALPPVLDPYLGRNQYSLLSLSTTSKIPSIINPMDFANNGVNTVHFTQPKKSFVESYLSSTSRIYSTKPPRTTERSAHSKTLSSDVIKSPHPTQPS
mmetsp:Transcript_36348/g.55557  ORF Transcript_36348/g.55557 Transcript_36348/m.55557 type:complete len:141 (+) Transcript_36348:1102-1524(+)